MSIKSIYLICFYLILTSCSHNNGESYPWIDLSWLNPQMTQVIIGNDLDKPISIEVEYFDKTSRYHKSETLLIKATQKDTFSVDLFRPELINIKYDEGQKTTYLVPQKDLEISISETLACTGKNISIYELLLEIGDNEKTTKELNIIFKNSQYPNWLRTFCLDSKQIKTIYDIYHKANYNQFIGESVTVSIKDSIESERILSDEQLAMQHNYFTLVQNFKWGYEFRKLNNDISNENYLMGKNLMEKISLIKSPEIKHNLLSMHTEGLMIRKRRLFKDKAKLYTDIIRKLPEAYVLKLNEIEKEYTEDNYSNADINSLLNKEIISTNGVFKPNKNSDKDFKLLKFWFAGCAPCKRQIPYENSLLAKSDNLEILHFCKNTNQEVWLDYIKKNDSRGSHYILEDSILDEYESIFNLSYSPRYVLLNKVNEVVCWECANPSDAEIEQLIKGN